MSALNPDLISHVLTAHLPGSPLPLGVGDERPFAGGLQHDGGDAALAVAQLEDVRLHAGSQHPPQHQLLRQMGTLHRAPRPVHPDAACLHSRSGCVPSLRPTSSSLHQQSRSSGNRSTQMRPASNFDTCLSFQMNTLQRASRPVRPDATCLHSRAGHMQSLTQALLSDGHNPQAATNSPPKCHLPALQGGHASNFHSSSFVR